jgi:D-threo-aldose 1-dehydrogenase
MITAVGNELIGHGPAIERQPTLTLGDRRTINRLERCNDQQPFGGGLMTVDARDAQWASISTELTPGPIPQLGFGCGDLYGGDRWGSSTQLVQAAFDAGIRYFDVARLYGDGSAEGVVGAALKPVRDKVVIATKVGIMPWSMQIGRRLAYKAASAARRLGPVARRWVPQPAAPSERYGAFAPDLLKRSVDMSLKALGTDYIDLLLLHECSPEDAAAPAVLDFLQSLQRAGKIRAFGVATHVPDTVQIIERTPELTRYVQIAADALEASVASVAGAGRRIATHSALKRALPLLRERFAQQPEAARRWSQAIGFSGDDTGALARVLLGLAAQDNRDGFVLFSTSRPDRIAQLMDSPLPSSLLDLARQEIRHQCDLMAGRQG